MCAWADAADEEEGESEQEEEDIFELEGQTEQLHLSPQAQPASAPERLQGRGGWEGAAGGDCPTLTHVQVQPAPLSSPDAHERDRTAIPV